MRKIIDWLINKWLAGFITGSIFFILKLYIDLPEKSKAIFFQFDWVKELMNTEISLLTVILIVLSIIFLTRIEKAILKAKYNNDDYSFLDAPKNRFENYKSDVFGVNNNLWTWHYEWSAFNQKFAIADLKPKCKQCGTPMEMSSYFNSHSADCHKCRLEGKHSTFHIHENISDVEKEIIRRIQTNEAKI